MRGGSQGFAHTSWGCSRLFLERGCGPVSLEAFAATYFELPSFTVTLADFTGWRFKRLIVTVLPLSLAETIKSRYGTCFIAGMFPSLELEYDGQVMVDFTVLRSISRRRIYG